MQRKLYSLITGLFIVLLSSGGTVSAAVCDLTTAGSSCTINGAIFQQIDPQSTGTGVINSFVEIGGNTDTVSAYNTTVNGVLNNGSSDQFNHALLVSELPVVTIGGVNYYQFLLDINQTGSDPLLSLNQLQIFTSTTPNQSGSTVSGTLVYDLGANVVNLDYSLNTGSGSGDMFLLVPTSVFGGASGTTNVYLFSGFGIPNNNNDGFEEWAIVQSTCTNPLGCNPPNVPEPQALLLVGAGLVVVGAVSRKRLRR